MSSDKSLQDIRNKIDEVDNNIAALYTKRMQLAHEIALAKAASGMPVANVLREKEIINRVTADMPDDIKLYGKQTFETLFETSRAYQYSTINLDAPIKRLITDALSDGKPHFPTQARVACQGVAGAYSGVAAEKLFPISSISYFKTWDGVFQAVEKDFCEFGVLPIENSAAGSVIGVYDLMSKHKFFIARSVKLKIKHYLLAKNGVKAEDIKEIVSHDQAIAQCGKFIKSLSPDIKITRCDNTAVAAKLVAESDRNDLACISSRECAGIYGLNIVKAGVNDNANNYTRFIAISKKLRVYEGANKISITLNLAHEAGSLNRILNKFSTLGLNLTKLESRPMPSSPFEFSFYFDFDAKVDDLAVQNLLADIVAETDNFEFLGAYEEIND